MSDTPKDQQGLTETEPADDAVQRRPYEAPRIEKKRSIHRVTLLSGTGVMSVGAISMTN